MHKGHVSIPHAIYFSDWAAKRVHTHCLNLDLEMTRKKTAWTQNAEADA